MEQPIRDLARIGGSHAQREVFEDTLLEAYIRAEQFENAEAMLTERLNRRASVRDEFWMGRRRPEAGEVSAAASTLKEAAGGWPTADFDSPEMANLERLTSNVA